MAIAKGKESTEATGYKRYIGVGAAFVKAVNPNKKEMEALYGREQENEPEYVGTVERDGKDIPNVRISFITNPDPEKYGEGILIPHTYFLRREYRYNSDKTKVQVIDKYGRTAWVTIEQAKNHEIPMYSNGPANLDKDYRPAFVGEEELTQFLINYLNIPNVMKYDRANNKWYLVDNPQDSECRLDEIEKYFKGDFTELRSAIALQPTNKVKILYGVRTSDDNKQYQTTYTRMTLKNSVTDYSKLDADVMEMKSRSTSASVAQTEYRVDDFQEYKVEATHITESTATTESSDLPFDDPFAL